MSRYKAQGFTLVELMVTIAVVAILAAVAFPSFQNVIRSNRVATATNEVIAAVAMARTEAIRNNRGASLCASSNGTSCAGTWNDGWIVWGDLNNNGSVDAGETVLRHMQLAGKMSISGPSGFLNFDSRGRRTNAGNAIALGVQPADCKAGQMFRRGLTLTPTGQLRKSTTALVACI